MQYRGRYPLFYLIKGERPLIFLYGDIAVAVSAQPNRAASEETTAKKLPLLTVPRQVARDLIYDQRMLNRVP